jgi:putative spermidine/putrescine transport system substrate-binding protein
VKDVPITMAPEESQRIIKEFGRDEYAAAIANNKQEVPLPPDKLVYALARWDAEVGAQKRN